VKLGKLGVQDTTSSPAELKKSTGDILSTKQVFSRISAKQRRRTEILHESCRRKKQNSVVEREGLIHLSVKERLRLDST